MASQRDINAKMRAILVILEWPTVPSERTRCSTDPWNARARVRTPSFVRSSVREEPFRLVPSLDVTPPRRWRRPPWESSRALEDGLAALACYRSLWAFDHAECPWAASEHVDGIHRRRRRRVVAVVLRVFVGGRSLALQGRCSRSIVVVVRQFDVSLVVHSWCFLSCGIFSHTLKPRARLEQPTLLGLLRPTTGQA